MPKKFRILLICSTIICLIVVLILGGLFAGGRIQPTPLPNPNGYDDFLQAAALVKGDPYSAPALKDNELRDFVRTNSEPLRLVRLGLTRTCSVPTDSVITNLSARMSDL